MPRQTPATGRRGSERFASGRGPRLGLCCQFLREPIEFRTTTAAALLRRDPEQRRQKLAELCLHNAASLEHALQYCGANGIGAFRIVSTILPLKTHPAVGYAIEELPRADEIVSAFRRCGATAAALGVRTTFHPDQFVVLNSPRPEVVAKSIEDLEYHAEVAEWVGADVINIHGGGAYGDKSAALERLARAVDGLSDGIRARLTLENDDRVYTPADLLAICGRLHLPLVYDVHHHGCLPDGMSVDEATSAALGTWNREPLFHVSSPLAGWSGPQRHRHHDEIDIADFPRTWLNRTITVDVEAKAKESAVLKLRDQLASIGAAAPAPTSAPDRRVKPMKVRAVRRTAQEIRA